MFDSWWGRKHTWWRVKQPKSGFSWAARLWQDLGQDPCPLWACFLFCLSTYYEDSRSLLAHYPAHLQDPKKVLFLFLLQLGKDSNIIPQRQKKPLLSTALPNPLALGLHRESTGPGDGHQHGFLWMVAEQALSSPPRATSTLAISVTVTKCSHLNLLRLQGTKCFELIGFYFPSPYMCLGAFLGQDWLEESFLNSGSPDCTWS